MGGFIFWLVSVGEVGGNLPICDLLLDREREKGGLGGWVGRIDGWTDEWMDGMDG